MKKIKICTQTIFILPWNSSTKWRRREDGQIFYQSWSNFTTLLLFRQNIPWFIPCVGAANWIFPDDRILHYLAAASVGYLQNYCYGIGTRVVFELGKETSSLSFPDHHLAFLVKNWNIYTCGNMRFFLRTLSSTTVR